jgi:hypothetical protein
VHGTVVLGRGKAGVPAGADPADWAGLVSGGHDHVADREILDGDRAAVGLDAGARARGRQLESLRACLLDPQGMRHRAYSSAMPALEKLGLVVSRPAQGAGRRIPAWFIIQGGRDHLAEIDASKRGATTRIAMRDAEP